MAATYPTRTTADDALLPIDVNTAVVSPAARQGYVKRYRMDVDLAALPPVPELPPAYEFQSWDDDLLENHGDMLFDSFRDEVDAIVFPSLSTRGGCKYLMRDISNRRGFVPQATWLSYWKHPIAEWCSREPCGTIQGVCTLAGTGAIQNLGVVPEHRGHGLGTALLLRSLWGFAKVGLRQAYLEVTASNTAAIRLYRTLGFRKTKTLYKAILPADVTVVE